MDEQLFFNGSIDLLVENVQNYQRNDYQLMINNGVSSGIQVSEYIRVSVKGIFKTPYSVLENLVHEREIIGKDTEILKLQRELLEHEQKYAEWLQEREGLYKKMDLLEENKLYATPMRKMLRALRNRGVTPSQILQVMEDLENEELPSED